MHQNGEEEKVMDMSVNPVEAEDEHLGDQVQEEQAEDLPGIGEDGVEGQGEQEEEHERQRVVRRPDSPTKLEIAEHNVSHIPFRPWCRHCVNGKGKRRQSLNLKGAFAEGHVARVRMDYSPLDDKSGTASDGDDGEIGEADDGIRRTVLVMQESECDSVWSYEVDHKGSTEAWVIDQICEDLETVGLRNERVIVKTDQETSANDIAREVAKNRSEEYGTGLDNSAVGASDTNATVERAVRHISNEDRLDRV